MKRATSDESNPCCHLSLHSSAQPDRQKRADTSHGIRRGNYPFVKLEKEFAEAASASARTPTSEDMHSNECHGTSSPGLVSAIQSNLQTVQRGTFAKDEKAKAEQGAHQEMPNPRTGLEGSDGLHGQNAGLVHSAD